MQTALRWIRTGRTRLRPVVLGFGILTALSPAVQTAAAPYQKIVISGEASGSGVYDASLEYTADGSTGYMAYSWVQIPQFVHTHLAQSPDHGQTWTYQQTINVSQGDTVTIAGTPTAGVWRHEVPALVHDPGDPGKEWKLYWHRYFVVPPYGDSSRHFEYGWIAYKYAPAPGGPWSAEIPLFGAGPFPLAPYSASVNLNTLHADLNAFLVYTEPGVLAKQGTLYLCLQGNTANPDEQTLFLIASSDHGANWTYKGKLLTHADALHFGYQWFSAPSLVSVAGRDFLLAAPGQDASLTHHGTYIFQFSNLSAGQLTRDSGGNLVAYGYVSPSISTFNAGESDYDENNYNGGIVMPQFDISVPASPEFQLWNTFDLSLAPPTPTPTPAITLTPTAVESPDTGRESPAVRAYPNPGRNRIIFLISPEPASGASVALYNLKGECVARLRTESAVPAPAWDCSSTAPGIYLARVTVDGREIARVKVGVVK